MLINWRNDDYEFMPQLISGGKEAKTRSSNIHAPVFGVDTESVETDGRYEMQCFTISDPKSDAIVYTPERANGLKQLLEYIIRHYAEWLTDEKYAFMYLHNLSYDFPQFAKTDERLVEMIKIGVGPEGRTKLYDHFPYVSYLEKGALLQGSAPHFTITIERGRNKFKLMFRDTFSYFPGTLEFVAKDLKLKIKKQKRQTDLGLRDFRKEDISEDKTYFEEYAMLDSRITQEAGIAIIKLHEQHEMFSVKPSAPGFAITSLFQMMAADETIRTGSWVQEDMQLIFDTYRGGRTGGIYHGFVKNLSVYDFHSSYPASMTSIPTFSETMEYIRVDDLSVDNVLSILEESGNVFLRISGIETDPYYPSLITTLHGKLTPIYGEFKNIATTGHEAIVGLKSGTLTITEVQECIVCVEMDSKKKNPFKIFAEKGYMTKAAAEKGTVVYIGEKIKLNSAYGKLIESRLQLLLGATDFATYLPYIEDMEKEFGTYYYEKYIEAVEQGLTLDDIYDELIDEIMTSFDEDVRSEMYVKMFGDFSVSGRVYGKYVVPGAASLITAISRSRLCAAMKCLKALYWDTDSVFINYRREDDPEAFDAKLALGSSWLAPGLIPLSIGEELGELDCEIDKASGWLAGTKRYYLEGINPDKNKFTIKLAIHGIPAMPNGEIDEEDLEEKQLKDKYKFKKQVIEMLANGSNYVYDSKPRPLKSKEAESAEVIGLFRSQRYESRFHLDERLQWERLSDHWSGSVTPYEILVQRKKKRNRKAEKQAKKYLGRIHPRGEDAIN
jgi:hypothetical protein